jgi:5-methylcytosine-specific restriction endonuclease McrA
MGGTKEADNIKNLMALCRECHLKYGDKKQYLEFLKEAHNEKLNNG